LFLEKFDYILISRPEWSISKTISTLKEQTLQEIAYKMDRHAFKLYSSLFLGNRTIVKKEMETTKESFKAWGLSHYLARSGLHLVIFVLIWHFILGLVPISYFFKQCFIIFLILIYATLSWSSVSFERALLMFLLYKFCLAHKVPIYYIHLITLATLIILLFNPLELFFLDFQLSFGITFALAWFNSIQAEKRRLAR
jgi:competence protein ComEC